MNTIQELRQLRRMRKSLAKRVTVLDAAIIAIEEKLQVQKEKESK